MRIIFVRHGEPDYEHDCLTETGKVQAVLAAKRLKDEGITEIWSSPLGRARQTAQAASEELGLPVSIVDCMREVSWGSVDGNPIFSDGHPWNIVDDMARKGVPLNTPDWRKYPDFSNNSVLECVDTVEKGIDKWLEGFGYIRNGEYYDHTTAEEDHKTIALFSHGGSSCAAIGHIINVPFPYACALFHFEFTGITIIRMDRKAGHGTLPCLELGNDGRHILDGHYYRLNDK
ncbi:MAG: histidine phosphatase family protein [Lachnospiraceae bacterium]|nr:histidine phosphatase family protein [Lachnospiraceae bacterium]